MFEPCQINIKMIKTKKLLNYHRYTQKQFMIPDEEEVMKKSISTTSSFKRTGSEDTEATEPSKKPRHDL